MSADQTFLDRIYDQDAEGQAQIYADWAASYDSELTENGYETPRRLIDALTAHASDKTAPVLDFGCGTGLAGLGLRKAGFETVDGWDMSQAMLEQAAAKGCYRALTRIEPDAPYPARAGAYSMICACGVITPHHAPPETLERLLALLPTGGVLGFSYNDHALEEAAFTDRVDALTESGAAALAFRENGPHIRRLDMTSDIILLRKA